MSSARTHDETAALWATGSLGKRARAPALLFGQVREDASVEADLLSAMPRPERVFAIASGGCTAFSLLAARDVELCAVDVNPAQVHLTILKRAALTALPYEGARAAITSDATRAYEALRSSLPAASRRFWDANRASLRRGMGRAGRVDAALGAAMWLFRVLVHPARRIERLLDAGSLDEQARTYAQEFDSPRLRAIVKIGLSWPLLRLVYGEAALRDLPQDFSAQMKRQLDDVFTRFRAADNGYLWQLFLGRYPDRDAALPPYLRRASFEAVRARLARAEVAHAEASRYLGGHPRAFDFLALSNILEVSSPATAGALLDAARVAARPGAVVCVRSIFPPRPFVRAAIDRAGLSIDEPLTRRAQRLDRSPFCRHIAVLRPR